MKLRRRNQYIAPLSGQGLVKKSFCGHAQYNDLYYAYCRVKNENKQLSKNPTQLYAPLKRLDT